MEDIVEVPPASDAESQIAVEEKKRFHSHAHSAHDSEGDDEHAHDVTAQVIGIGILEFGVILHRSAFVSEKRNSRTDYMRCTSVLIGLTLAVDPNFKVLFVVLVFHRACLS